MDAFYFLEGLQTAQNTFYGHAPALASASFCAAPALPFPCSGNQFCRLSSIRAQITLRNPTNCCGRKQHSVLSSGPSPASVSWFGKVCEPLPCLHSLPIFHGLVQGTTCHGLAFGSLTCWCALQATINLKQLVDQVLARSFDKRSLPPPLAQKRLANMGRNTRKEPNLSLNACKAGTFGAMMERLL